MHVPNLEIESTTYLKITTMSEKLRLQRVDFKDNVDSLFRRLRVKCDFADVTLACEDGQQVEAHKVILASSSPFFLNLLRRNTHAHPLVFMRGLKFNDLMAIIDFVYYGEVHVFSENLDSFLAIAKELKLEGLTDEKSGEERDCKESLNILTKREQSQYSSSQEEKESPNGMESNEYEIHHGPGKTNAQEAQSNVPNVIRELNEKVKSMMKESQNFIPDGKHRTRKASICKVCGKEGARTNIMNHIEAHHLDGIIIPCISCDKTFHSRNALTQHKLKYHNSPTYDLAGKD